MLRSNEDCWDLLECVKHEHVQKDESALAAAFGEGEGTVRYMRWQGRLYLQQNSSYM